jgi:hypothetical protein
MKSSGRVGLGTAQTWVSAQNADYRRETHLRLRYRIPSRRCLLPYTILKYGEPEVQVRNHFYT